MGSIAIRSVSCRADPANGHLRIVVGVVFDVVATESGDAGVCCEFEDMQLELEGEAGEGVKGLGEVVVGWRYLEGWHCEDRCGLWP